MHRYRVKALIPFSIFILLSSAFNSVSANSSDETLLNEQRKLYRSASKALKAGKLKTFESIAAQITGYPLYPYLRYDYLSRRLWKVKNQEIKDFLDQYSDLPRAKDLRRSWLKMLAKRQKWQTYVDNYTQQSDKTLQCYQLIARMKTGNKSYLLEDIRTVWLDGESLPPQCDPAFALLYKSELMNDELVWQRIRLAMDNRKTGLAQYLSRRLGADKKIWADRWLAIYHNPSRGTNKPSYADDEVAREILLYGIHRLLRQNIDRALQRWENLKDSYSFTETEISEVDVALAARAARKKHKKAKLLLDAVQADAIDEKMLHLRLRTALADLDWDRIVAWTQSEPADEKIRLRWYYWRARALEQTGNVAAAREIYTWLAKERDYYGFLAADQLGIEYSMNYHPLPEDLEEWEKLNNLPAFQRARELRILGSQYSARREWHHALPHLTSYQKQIAASIAANWGWHDRAIITLAKAELYDDLVTRFPLPYSKTIRQFSTMRNIDLAWMYALIRAESAFMEEVRSPAGALGLMQVMPATGKLTAKNIGLRNYNTAQLKQSGKNVRIGSAYLKQMHKSFNENKVLATAAYNAGPTNVKRWLPKKNCVEADVWIEQIPFTETRKYVRRILYFASVYDWRLKQPVTTVKERMSEVQPKKLMLAGKQCPTA